MKTINLLKAGAGALMLATAQLQAQSLAYNYPAALTANESAGQISGGPYDAANVFTVNSSIYVNELGLFSTGANPNPFGVGQSAQVSIYSVTISLNELDTATLAVGPVSFSQSSPGTLVAGTSTLAQGISSVLLTPGLYMVAVNNFGGPGLLPYYDNDLAPVNSATANTTGGYLSFGGSFLNDDNVALGNIPPSNLPDWGFWSLGLNNAPRFADANFGFVPVPEPGVLEIGTVGFVLVLFACVSRCKNRSKKSLTFTTFSIKNAK